MTSSDFSSVCVLFSLCGGGCYRGLRSTFWEALDCSLVEYFKDYPTTLPNYSLGMSNLAASAVRPQIKTPFWPHVVVVIELAK